MDGKAEPRKKKSRKPGKHVKGVIFKKGSWRVRCYLNRQEYAVKCDSQAQAAAVLGRLKADYREGRLFPKAKAAAPIRLNTYVETWLNNQPARGKKIVTIKTYAWRLRKHVLPVFGSMALADITRPQLKTWAATLLAKGLDFDTASNVLVTLSGVLSEAVEDGLFATNHALRASKLLKRPNTIEEQELPIFTLQEEQDFLATVHEHMPSAYAMVLTFFRTGLRAGETMGLHREDLDLRSRTIHVRRNWTHGRLGTPKNGKTRRVDMSSGSAATLTEWIELQDLEAAASGSPAPEILFPGHIGGTRREPSYMRENSFRYQTWFPMLKQAGVRRLNLHAARHTFASRLIANGENLKYVSEQLGHASIAITCDVYGHLIPGGNRQAVDRLDKMGSKMGTGESVHS